MSLATIPSHPQSSEQNLQALHQRIVSKGWQLSHMRFVHARQLQAAGKAGDGRSLFHYNYNYKLNHADTTVQLKIAILPLVSRIAMVHFHVLSIRIIR